MTTPDRIGAVWGTLAGVALGFLLAEGSRVLREKSRRRRLRRALEAECRSLVAQIPQLVAMTERCVQSLRQGRAFPGRHVRAASAVYNAVIVELAPYLTLRERNVLLAGLFFAAEQTKDDKGTLLDGKLFMIDTYKCATGKYFAADGKERHFTGVASSRHPAFEVALHRISRWDDKKSFPKFIIPVRPDHQDRRITAQRSHFTFHVPDHPVLDKAQNPSLVRLLVPSGAKKTILDQLFLLGIDDHSIYGDLESLAKRLRAAYKITTPARRV